jgi:hypothetical protein
MSESKIKRVVLSMKQKPQIIKQLEKERNINSDCSIE